ncbi:ATP synthase subunit B [Betaproteobacteria bacterium UKL13-2]|jgi:F-type H+-transporting ATPase subunit b|nr:ATP synthase subunit B [Betaproteobacteria bacterium UKL13-2]HCG52592.1 F0F1 ATP synthase subunit B [Betaproteobacteria bacterium]
MSLNATLFGMAVWFILLIWFAYAKIWPPLVGAIDERRKKIAEGLAEAEKGKAALADGEKQKSLILKEARDQAGEFKALNEKQAQSLIDEAKAQAKVEADRIIAAAHASAATELQKAREQLRDQVAVLAVAGAEKILKREVDAKAHADMLNQLKAQL